jgi:hypothetical protein
VSGRVGEKGMHQRHQESLYGVEFGRGDGVLMREIVDDAPCLAFVAQWSCGCPRLHEFYVRMRTLESPGRALVIASRGYLRCDLRGIRGLQVSWG